MVMNSTTVMKVEEEETVMMKKKKNDDDDEEHGETNNNNSRNVLGKIQHPTPPQTSTVIQKKNKSCTTEAIMKHMLVPIKNLCIQSLSEDVCNLVTGLGIVHFDGPKLHLLLSQVVGHMKVPGFS